MTNRWAIWTALAVVAAAATAFFLLGRMTAPVPAEGPGVDSLLYEMRIVSRETERALVRAEVALRLADSLGTVARSARQDAQRSRSVADSLRRALASAGSAVDSLPVVVAALDSSEAAYAELDAAYTVQEGLAAVYRDATDSLRTVVDTERTARVAAVTALSLRPAVPEPPCRVLRTLPCPVLTVGPSLGTRGAGLAVTVGFPVSLGRQRR